MNHIGTATNIVILKLYSSSLSAYGFPMNFRRRVRLYCPDNKYRQQKKKETRIEWKTKRIGEKIWPHVVENGDKLEWKMNAMRMTCPNTEFIIIVSWMLQQTVKVFAQNVCVCMCRFFCCFFVSFLCWATVKCWFRTEWVSNHTAIDFRRNRNRREKKMCVVAQSMRICCTENTNWSIIIMFT